MRRITAVLLCIMLLPAIARAMDAMEREKSNMAASNPTMGSFHRCEQLKPSDGPLLLQDLVNAKNRPYYSSTLEIVGETPFRTIRTGSLESIQVSYVLEEVWEQGWAFYSGQDASALRDDCLVSAQRRGEDGIALTRRGRLNISQRGWRVYWLMTGCPK